VAAWSPPPRELLRVYRRVENRSEVRSDRFVAGFSSEQFALPEAIELIAGSPGWARTLLIWLEFSRQGEAVRLGRQQPTP
jgi:hypothetical protein